MSGNSDLKTINCSFCEEPITRDRYNFYLRIERQDSPGKSEWSRSTVIPTEDCCPNCFDLIQSYIQYIRDNIRKNKGEFKNAND